MGEIMLDKLNQVNDQIKILSIFDEQFKNYGNILQTFNFKEYIDYLEKKTRIPSVGNEYIANDCELEILFKANDYINNIFGNLQLQYGYVNGNNSYLNALEYHKTSEINIAVSPLVLMLGYEEDIKNAVYDSSKLKAFYLPEGTVIELYPKVLHFSPCKVSNQGFKCGVILPYKTNQEFCLVKNITTQEDKLLFKTNKWLLAHPENKRMIELGAFIGITGKNIEIKY